MTEEGSFLRDTACRWSANKSIKPGVYNCLMKVADRIDAEMVELPRGKDELVPRFDAFEEGCDE